MYHFYTYFAGPIFTDQMILSYAAFACIATAALLSTFIHIARKIRARQSSNKPRLRSSVFIAVTVVTVLVIAVFVIPTRLKDAAWDKKQQTCAVQAGYASPADDNTNQATAESQYAYSTCLGL